MKQFLAALPCIAVPFVLTVSNNGYKVAYGGSLSDVKTGTALHLFIDQDKVRFVDNGKEVASIPASAITEISYGQDVHRRVGSAIAVGAVTLGPGASHGPE